MSSGAEAGAERRRLMTSPLDAHQRTQQHRQLRGVLLADGTTINCFRKNTHETHTIVLERAGHTYTYIHPDGSQTRHLSPTVLSSHRAMVIETIELRNRFAWQTSVASRLLPYVHRSLCPNEGGLVRRLRRRGIDSGQPLRARWPTGAFSTEKLYEANTQRFEIRSIEGNARVCLHPSATLVDVFFVVQAKLSVDTLGEDQDKNEARADDSSSHVYYATIQQTFTLHHAPPCFAYPVQVLLRAKNAACDPNSLEFELSPDEARGLFPSSELPGNSAFTARPTFSALSTSHGSGTSDDASEAGLALTDVLRVASRPTRQFYERVAVEVKEDAIFCICKPGQDVLPSVIVQLAGQEAVIECTRGFFRWYGENGKLQQQFTIETIPPATFFSTADSSSTSSVLSLCQHAMDLLRSHGGGTTSASVALRHDIAGDDTAEVQAAPSSSVIVEAVETEHGRFRAFADGKVRVVFQDRTILQVDACQELCSFFFADGTAGQTTVDAAPPEQRNYINRALEFADWAFATPRERMLRYMRRQLHEEVAHQELQKIGIRFGMNHHLHEGAVDTNGEEAMIGNNKTTPQQQQHELDSRTDDTPHYLTLPMIKQLQEATQQHIASVNVLLHAPAATSSPSPDTL